MMVVGITDIYVSLGLNELSALLLADLVLQIDGYI